MNDHQLRALEQRYTLTGSPEDLSALLAQRRRLGLACAGTPRLALAARCGSPLAAQLLDLPREPLGPGCPRGLARRLRREPQGLARPASLRIAAINLRAASARLPRDHAPAVNLALRTLASAEGVTWRRRTELHFRLAKELAAWNRPEPRLDPVQPSPWLLDRSTRVACEALIDILARVLALELRRPGQPAAEDTADRGSAAEQAANAGRLRVLARSLGALERWALEAPVADEV